jgi:hypothetical protein
VAAPFQFQSEGDQWIGVAVGADIRENNAQMEAPEPITAQLYEGNLSGLGPASLAHSAATAWWYPFRVASGDFP